MYISNVNEQWNILGSPILKSMLKNIFSISAIWIVIISYLVIVPASKAEKSATWVGILWEDGIITPVGVFKSGKWKTSWPEPVIHGHFRNDKGEPLPKSLPLDKIPSNWLSGCEKMPENWRLVRGGSAQHNLRVQEAVEFQSQGSRAWGLKTAFLGKVQTPEGVEPKIKEGMVTSGIVKGWASVVVDSNSKESETLLKFLRDKFDLAEQEALSRGEALYTGHPTSKEERIRKPIKAKTVFKMRAGREKQATFFISIIRQYEQPKKQYKNDCYAESLFNVWVSRNNQQYRIMAMDMILTDCYGKEGNWITPLGVLSIESKEYIISMEFGYESENYTIRMLDKDAMKTVLSVWGGGC